MKIPLKYVTLKDHLPPPKKKTCQVNGEGITTVVNYTESKEISTMFIVQL
jgi:hypothetical protein